jgi:hypothetical protein
VLTLEWRDEDQNRNLGIAYAKLEAVSDTVALLDANWDHHSFMRQSLALLKQVYSLSTFSPRAENSDSLSAASPDHIEALFSKYATIGEQFYEPLDHGI